jgi:hypothetical protein
MLTVPTGRQHGFIIKALAQIPYLNWIVAAPVEFL